MHKTWHLLKLLVASILVYSGLLRLIVRRKLRNRVVILTYHRVLDQQRHVASHSVDGIVVSDHTFEKNLEVLRNYFEIISLQDLQDSIYENGRIPSGACAITFDDGWLDNYEVAFPILRNHHVPATIFLPVAFIDNTKMFWQEELMMQLSLILECGNDEDLLFLKKLTSSEERPDVKMIRHFISQLKAGSNTTVEKVLEKVRMQLGETAEIRHYNRYMTWAQLHEMASNDIFCGSHCVSHRRLTRLSAAECAQELSLSREELESRLGIPVTTLAYPNGDCNDAIKAQAKEAGYKLAFTTETGMLSANSDLLAIPRVNIHESCASNNAMFLCTVLGIFSP